MMDGWSYGNGMNYGYFGIGGVIMMFIVLVLIGIGIYLLVRGTRGSMPAQGSAADDALAILRKRYANGEIDQKEFEQRKKTLSE